MKIHELLPNIKVIFSNDDVLSNILLSTVIFVLKFHLRHLVERVLSGYMEVNPQIELFLLLLRKGLKL